MGSFANGDIGAADQTEEDEEGVKPGIEYGQEDQPHAVVRGACRIL